MDQTDPIVCPSLFLFVKKTQGWGGRGGVLLFQKDHSTNLLGKHPSEMAHIRTQNICVLWEEQVYQVSWSFWRREHYPYLGSSLIETVKNEKCLTMSAVGNFLSDAASLF